MKGHIEFIEIIIGLLSNEKASKLNLIVLSLMNKVFYLGELHSTTIFKDTIFDKSLNDTLENTQTHQDSRVYYKVVKLIDKYFETDDNLDYHYTI